jgi:hypothetical protein
LLCWSLDRALRDGHDGIGLAIKHGMDVIDANITELTSHGLSSSREMVAYGAQSIKL